MIDLAGRVAIVTEGPGLAKRVEEVLRDHEVPVDRLADTVPSGRALIATASLGRGFVDEAARIEVLTETDLTGQVGSSTSTRCSCGPATTSCTSSTASAVSSR